MKVNAKAEKPSFQQDIKSPYCFEFLGLSAKDTIDEDDLEVRYYLNNILSYNIFERLQICLLNLYHFGITSSKNI